MQKIFRKYMILITTAAILSILVIHYHLSMYFLESQQLNTFNTKISQIIRTLEANRSAQASAQSGPDEDYLTIFSKFPTGIGEEFFAIHVQADKVIAHSDGVLSAHLEKYYRLEVLSGCENGSYKKMADNQINYVVTRHYGNVLIGASYLKIFCAEAFGRICSLLLLIFFYLRQLLSFCSITSSNARWWTCLLYTSDAADE